MSESNLYIEIWENKIPLILKNLESSFNEQKTEYIEMNKD